MERWLCLLRGQHSSHIANRSMDYFTDFDGFFFRGAQILEANTVFAFLYPTPLFWKTSQCSSALLILLQGGGQQRAEVASLPRFLGHCGRICYHLHHTVISAVWSVSRPLSSDFSYMSLLTHVTHWLHPSLFEFGISWYMWLRAEDFPRAHSHKLPKSTGEPLDVSVCIWILLLACVCWEASGWLI